ncbi:hypothetical protein ACRAWF_15530 [Streptomyces sp. L7]
MQYEHRRRRVREESAPAASVLAGLRQRSDHPTTALGVSMPFTAHAGGSAAAPRVPRQAAIVVRRTDQARAAASSTAAAPRPARIATRSSRARAAAGHRPARVRRAAGFHDTGGASSTSSLTVDRMSFPSPNRRRPRRPGHPQRHRHRRRLFRLRLPRLPRPASTALVRKDILPVAVHGAQPHAAPSRFPEPTQPEEIVLAQAPSSGRSPCALSGQRNLSAPAARKPSPSGLRCFRGMDALDMLRRPRRRPRRELQ